MSYLQIWSLTLLVGLIISFNIGLICSAYKDTHTVDDIIIKHLLNEIGDEE